jgi:hypothetical protein
MSLLCTNCTVRASNNAFKVHYIPDAKASWTYFRRIDAIVLPLYMDTPLTKAILFRRDPDVVQWPEAVCI